MVPVPGWGGIAPEPRVGPSAPGLGPERAQGCEEGMSGPRAGSGVRGPGRRLVKRQF